LIERQQGVRRGVLTLERQWFAVEAQARADLARHQDALAAAGWTPVPFRP
jgi:hypothetical protein